MRKLSFFIIIAAILVMAFGVVQPATAGTPGLFLIKNQLDTSFIRSWSWTIDKTGSVTDLTLSLGQTGMVDYGVAVVGTPTDSGWVVNGSIQLMNKDSASIIVNSLVVAISGDISATVTCPDQWDFPPEVWAGYSVFCSYSVNLPDGSARTSKVVATLSDGSVVESNELPITFVTPASVTGQTIHVTDSLAGDLGEVTGSTDPTLVTFSYNHQIGPYDVCGAYKVSNTASIVETGLTDTWDVNVNVPCAGGCTLTPGYWKTHSQLGPAPYDMAWLNLSPEQEQTSFFSSGESWYGVFWTAPQGNPYYILAHAYMAAKLNVLDGASTTPAVTAAIAFAENFFSTNTPTPLAKGDLKQQVINNASILDQYNNGLVGPGHCSE